MTDEKTPNENIPDEEPLDTPSETAEPETLKEEAKISPLDALKKEADEFKDKYFRTLADTENMRKRLLKEKQEMTAFAKEQLISEFLTPLDHLENALKATDTASDELKHWGIGFKMILTQFKDVLSNHGVTAFESVGKPFDPHLHEAVEAEEREDVKPETVTEEFVKGYKMGTRTIRPARVKVSKAAKKE